MICDSCVHVIMRTTQNGTQDPVTSRICDLDGANTSYQLKECSRKEERFNKPVLATEIRLLEPEPIVVEGPPEVIPYMQKRGLLRGKKRGS